MARRRKPGELLESQFQEQVVDLAAICGFYWVHFRPARTLAGWATPVQGPLGMGWPDLTLARPRDRRLVFVELKRLGGELTPEQVEVLAILRAVAEVYVWSQADMDSGLIPEMLR